MKNIKTEIMVTSRKSWLVITMIIFFCLSWSNTHFVHATTDNINLGINANVNAKCVFKTGVNIAFGVYDPVVANLLLPSVAAGSFNVKCTKNTTSQISMGSGLYSGNAISTTRAMNDGFGNYISYEIFTTAAHSIIWNTTNTVSFTDLGGVSTAIPVFALVPPAQNVTAGNYSDTVTMTITY